MQNHTIQHISDSYLCSNCGACSAICAKDAISFEWSSMGRMYALVDEDKCVDCGRCMKVCPSIVEPSEEDFADRFVGNIRNLYVGRATNEKIFQNAQSGGICTALLYYLFETGKIDCAVVCLMVEGSPTPVVKAKIITDKTDLLSSQKSCYTPVEMLSILKQTHGYKSVAFVGLPCHIEGLTHLQEESKKFSNITYKIGLICDRTMCSTVMDVFASYNKNKPIKIDWRRKYDEDTGYHYKDASVVVFSKGKSVRIPNKHRFLMKDFFTAPRCRVCFDKLNIMSDIALGDPWRMPNVEMTQGASAVITRTENGQKLIDQAMVDGAISLEQHPKEEIIPGQLIDERRESVKKFSSELKSLVPSTDSYLLENTNEDEQSGVLSQFINREKYSKTKVTKEALRLIKSQGNSSFVEQLTMRVKALIKKIIKK